MSIPDHEIEVGPWPEYFPEEEPIVRICGNCIHYAPEASVLVDMRADRHPCAYPMPEYIRTFFKIAGNMLPTEGKGCAVHKLEGEE